jgi:hypothetical protein
MRTSRSRQKIIETRVDQLGILFQFIRVFNFFNYFETKVTYIKTTPGRIFMNKTIVDALS